MKTNFFMYIFIGFVLLLCLKIYKESEFMNLKCVISGVDGNRYCVRNRVDTKEAADLLAKVTQNMTNLVKYMQEKHGDDPRVQRLVKGFNPQKISETLPTSVLTT